MGEYKGRNPEIIAKIKEKERIEKKKNIIKSCDHEEGIKEYISVLNDMNYAKLRNEFDTIFTDKNEYQNIHNRVYTKDNESQFRMGLIDGDLMLKEGMVNRIEEYLIQKLEKYERNRKAKNRRRGNKREKQRQLLEDLLVKEIESIFSSTNRNSSQCRERYFKACIRFVKWLTFDYRTNTIGNIKQEQLEAYIVYMQRCNYSSTMMRTEIYAIFYLQNFVRFRYQLDKKKLLQEVKQ